MNSQQVLDAPPSEPKDPAEHSSYEFLKLNGLFVSPNPEKVENYRVHEGVGAPNVWVSFTTSLVADSYPQDGSDEWLVTLHLTADQAKALVKRLQRCLNR